MSVIGRLSAWECDLSLWANRSGSLGREKGGEDEGVLREYNQTPSWSSLERCLPAHVKRVQMTS